MLTARDPHQARAEEKQKPAAQTVSVAEEKVAVAQSGSKA